MAKKGPIIWEAKRVRVTLKGSDGLPGKSLWLLVARNVLDGELKFFVSNASEFASMAMLLQVTFQRWRVERCFEDQKQEIGLDCYAGRRYLGLKRQLVITAISYLFLSQTCTQERKKNGDWTIQRVRDAVDVIVVSWFLPRKYRRIMLDQAAGRIGYHQSCNAAARQSHTQTKLERYAALGIDPDAITRCRWQETDRCSIKCTTSDSGGVWCCAM